jgi:hypothetical protein
MRISALLLAIAALELAIAPAKATADPGGTSCCSRCGCHAACVEKSCQVVCDVKKEKKTYWCVECSEFCTLLPGHRECGECRPPEPRCGRTKCVQKLVRKEYEVERPVYKCLVVYLCPACANGQSPEPAAIPAAPTPQPSAPLPPKPLPPVSKVKK